MRLDGRRHAGWSRIYPGYVGGFGVARVRSVCEGISVPETLKVKNLCLELVLYSVDHKDLKLLFMHNTDPSPRSFWKDTYITNFVLTPVRIGALTELTDV